MNALLCNKSNFLIIACIYIYMLFVKLELTGVFLLEKRDIAIKMLKLSVVILY